MKKRTISQWIGVSFLLICTMLVIAFLGIIIFDIFTKGASSLSWNFISDNPRKGMTEGGIFPAVMGSFLVTMMTALVAIPLGIACAVYLSEYAKDNTFTRLIRASIRNLAGVPSIIYGLFGVAIFVQGFQLGTSVMASGLTLGLLSLPYIITTTEESLKIVPRAMREGALALGATQWETIRTIVLPSAIPGILTGTILALSRAAGETAPILFTGVVFYQRYLPSSLMNEFMALPYHLYILSTQHHAIQQVRPLAYGTAMVLIGLIFLLNIVAFIIRSRYRVKY